MNKKIFLAAAILLIGFLLGGVTFYVLEKSVEPRGYFPHGHGFTPNVPRQIMETGRAFSDIVNSVTPAVVNISTTKIVRRETGSPFDDPFFDFFGPFHDFGAPKKWKEWSLGSGVIVSPDGYIITNNHVVEKADEINVTLLDRRTFKGKIVGVDPKTDIAIVKINTHNLPTLIWGNSDTLQVGEFVLAIGSPYGLSHTVTMGIISAVGRANVGIADYEDFIQTDAAINPGNSGGPLVNVRGEFIGINTAIFSKTGGYQGIGFAVPSNMVRLIMEQLIQKGKVVRGWIGVTIQELTPELSEKFGLKRTQGALVSDVSKGSPAARAGIMRGDVIIEFNGKEVKDVSGLRNLVAQSKAGTAVPVKILRSGKEHTFKVAIVELPREIAEITPARLPDEIGENLLTGLTVMDLTREIIRQLGFNKDEKGVIVVQVEPGSPADDAQIKKGDIIKEIDKKEIDNLGDFNRTAANLRNDESVLLFVNRSGKNFYVILEAP
ncbi:MAG: DegQ family serine endoprotease [Nitrospirota bacterium]